MTSLDNKKTRRSVACRNCHSLKVKCTPADVNNPGGSCVRCLNTKKVCEIDLNQPRKRRKKADILQEREKIRQQSSNYDSDSGVSYKEFSGSENNKDSKNSYGSPEDDKERIGHLENEIYKLKKELAAAKATANGTYPSESVNLARELKVLSRNNASTFVKISKELKKSAESRAKFIDPEAEKVDVISKLVITSEEAEKRLEIYREQFYSRYPYVDIPDISAVEFANKTPHLFNAVMCVASLALTQHAGDEGINQIIEIVTTKHIMLQVFVAGNKKEEYLLALVLLCYWYSSPELVKQRRFHLLNALAIGMLHDLGIVAKNPNPELGLIDENFTNAQQRKIVMLLYISTVSTCLILRRTIYVKWTPYVEECCVYLENSDDYKMVNLALLSRFNHILEKIHNTLHSGEVNFENTVATSWIILEFQKTLDLMKSKINHQGPASDTVLCYFYSVEAYLHEPVLSQIAASTCVSDDEGNSLNDEEKPANIQGRLHLKPEAIKPLAKCVKACLKCLEYFNLIDCQRIALMPLFLISRVIYTAGMLLRLRYLILAFPSQIQRQLLPPSAIEVVQGTNLKIMQTTELYPYNYCVKKSALMLQLFIQTYANQIRSLLGAEKEYSGNLTKEQLTSVDLTIPDTHEFLTVNSAVSPESRLSLDILSYAASVRSSKKDKNSTKSSKKSEDENDPNESIIDLQNSSIVQHLIGKPIPRNRSDFEFWKRDVDDLSKIKGAWEVDPNTSSSKSRSSTILSRSIPISSSVTSGTSDTSRNLVSSYFCTTAVPGVGDSAIQNVDNIQTNQNTIQHNNNVANGPRPLNGSNPNNIPNGSNNFQNRTPVPTIPHLLNSPPSNVTPSESQTSGENGLTLSDFGFGGFDDLNNNAYNINEEFWSDIVNPSANNFNFGSKGQVSNDVFFMNG